MRIYSDKNVYETALDRIRFLFDEFENVIVGFSGGKDSTVTLQLSLIVAEEKNRLPLKVLFIDQEAEWKGTIDYVSKIMHDKRVEPLWFQMPMVISNNASSYDRFSYCWNEEEKDKWIHPKSDISIKVNNYGTDRFHDLFGAIFKKDYEGIKSCYLAGVRAEEAPKRAVALTHAITYKTITYGKVLSKKNQHYTFYPLYDWSYTDIWKAIHDNKWDYNIIYNELYRHGVKLNEMRISNVHHETALNSLLLIQEIEPETWVKVTERINGANTIKHLQKNSYECPRQLPYMFTDWKEYAIHLANNIIQQEEFKELFLHKVNGTKKLYSDSLIIDEYYKALIKTILSSDWDFTKFRNWEMTSSVYSYRIFKQGRREASMMNHLRYFTSDMKEELINYIKEKYEVNK